MNTYDVTPREAIARAFGGTLAQPNGWTVADIALEALAEYGYEVRPKGS
jgi:hypothetical protein